MARTIINATPIAVDESGRLLVAGNTELDAMGRWYVRTDSRPRLWDICFAGAGDDAGKNAIGGGKVFEWDFSNGDDLDPSPPSGYKRKIVQFQFMDNIKVKEGTIYFFDAPKGAYIDFYIICPDGGYYSKKWLDENDEIQSQIALATEDTPIVHWVINYRICGSTPMGDELNTEAADEDQIPSYFVWSVEITTPDTDSTSHGHFSLEIYRQRTIYFAPPA